MIFQDRQDAGRQLATKLNEFKNKPKVIILGLPRGGVVTAYEIAKELNLPLDIVVPRKIGAPSNPEFAVGAITEDGEPIIDQTIISQFNFSSADIKQTIAQEKEEAKRRLKLYRGDKPPLALKNKTVILVDDGIATGATMQAAILSAKTKGAKQIIIAVPVIASDTLEKLKAEVDRIIYLKAPLFFGAVGAFYKEFEQTTDEEVIIILKKFPTA